MDKGLSSRISNLLLIVFLAAIILLSTIKLLFPAGDYRQQITQHLAEHLGQPVEIIGTLEWYLSPFPSLFASSIVVPTTGVTLQGASVSFSLPDLLLLKVVPSSVKVDSVTSISNLKSVPLIEQVVVSFDSSGMQPNRFEFAINSSALLPSDSYQKVALNRPNVNIQGDIQHLDVGRYHIKGRLTNATTTKQTPEPILKDTHIQLDVAKGDNPNTQLFNLSLSASEFNLSSNGIVKATKQEVLVTFDEFKTPNMALSGQTVWQRANPSIENTLQGKHISIPAICFEKPHLTNSAHCYDLAMLMMLPGKNTLQAQTLDTHQQILQDINLDWVSAGDEIIIHSGTAHALGGTLNIEGGFTLAANSWHFDLKGKNIQIESLLQTLGHKPQLYGAANINLHGSGQFKNHQLLNHKINGNVTINNGKTTLFNLEKELCSQVTSVVATNSNTTPFEHLAITIDEVDHHLNIPYFISELDGAHISGQGEIATNQTISLVMNVKLEKEEWALCKLPRVLTGVEWPLSCNKPMGSRGDCSINLKQMGLSALLLADEPDRKDKAKQQVQTLKKSDKVKKVLSRLEKWLDE